MDMMKAVIYHGPGDVRVQEVPKPTCGEGEILVQCDACAVCGSDLKTYKVGNPRMQPGVVMGHEFSGLIREISPTAKAEGLAVGDRVVMATSVSCGLCLYCRRGWRNLCANIKPMGFGYNGGMARWCAIPAQAVAGGHVVAAPVDMPAAHAALAEPVSCAVNSIEQCNMNPGDVVLVLGAGPMGLLNALVARAKGASKIILSEPNPARLAQAEPFCDVCVNPTESDLAAVVAAETEDGLGADVCIVAAPANQPQEQALSLVRKRGTICLFASLPVERKMLDIDSRLLHYGELRLVGTSDSTPAHVAEAVQLLASGAVPADKIATHSFPLDEIQTAFDLMLNGEGLRIILEPN